MLARRCASTVRIAARLRLAVRGDLGVRIRLVAASAWGWMPWGDPDKVGSVMLPVPGGPWGRGGELPGPSCPDSSLAWGLASVGRPGPYGPWSMLT